MQECVQLCESKLAISSEKGLAVKGDKAK